MKLGFDIEPQTQLRPRAKEVMNRGTRKKKIIVYDPEEVKRFKANASYIARHLMKGEAPLSGPLFAKIDFFRPMPKSFSKKKQEQAEARIVLPLTKPDVTNYSKAFEDALNGIVWEDDATIIQEVISKYYSKRPRIEIEVRQIEEGELAIKGVSE